ncbi:glycosyl hydrolase family 28 protein [Pontiellaceae bacterium B1224]|nr:glycosyl hydrolase family 28 protein [Pontiellaceae bacterium B1224]
MNRRISLMTIGAGLASQALAMSRTPAMYAVKTFGAKGDGITLDTKAVQSAIDACKPGGVVFVEPGQYVVGTLKLKSDMELQVAEGAELLGSTSLADYATDNQGAIEAPAFDKCLLYAENAKNIHITGGGIIDGRGARETFPVKLEDGSLGDRPMLIRFVDCKNVQFTKVTFKNAASWCVHLVSCDAVKAVNVTIDSHVNTNNDGFDLDGCSNVLIEGCDIHTGDDSICPKSTTMKLCENITVKNCRAQSHTAAFKCGTSSRGGFRNISISDCDFSNTRMGVIKLLTVDGGILENISISNIVMNDVEGPVFIRLGNRGRIYDKPTEQVYGEEVKPEGAPPGTVKNIKISNIKAIVAGDIQKRNGIMISGIPDHYIEDVVLENIEISFPGGGTAEDAAREVPEDEARYPEQFFFGVLPSWGAYVRHAKNVTFKNVNLTTRQPDARKELVLVDVNDFSES